MRRRLSVSCGALAAVSVALLAAPAAPAATGWSPAPTYVPDGPGGADEVALGKRLRNDLAVDRAGASWFAWAQDADTRVSTEGDSLQRIRIAQRPAGGVWQLPETVAQVTRLSGTSYETLSGPRVDVDGAGRPTVLWGVRTSATSVTLNASTRATGGSWSAPAQLATVTGPAAQLKLALDVAPDGSAVAAWQGRESVQVAIRSDSGTWSGAETVATTTVDVLDTVDAGRDQDGAVTVVWREGASNTTREIKASVRNGSGGWEPAATLTAAPAFASRPSVEVDATGAAIATWGSDDGPRAAVRPAGGAWQPPVVLASGAANAATTVTNVAQRTLGGAGIPSAAFDAHGNATVVWPEAADAASSTPARVRARTFTASGSWGAPETVADDATSGAGNGPRWPRVALGPDGAATVVWTRGMALEGGNVTGGDVKTATRPAAGAPWSAVTTFVATGNPANYGSATATALQDDGNLSVAGDPLGNVAAGWSRYHGAASPSVVNNEAVAYEAPVAQRLDWTARGLTGPYNLRTWVRYLRTPWAGPCRVGDADVLTSGGASQPDAGDRDTWRLTQESAWRDVDSGKLIVQYRGTIRWAQAAHCIDNRVIDPRLEIATDEQSARLYADGQASGSMADAIAGRPSTTPLSNVRVLDLDLSGAGPRTSGDGATRSWSAVPSRLSAAAAGAYGLDLYLGQPFGFLQISIPSAVETRRTEIPEPPVEQPRPPLVIDPPKPPVQQPRPPAEQPRTPVRRPSGVSGKVLGGAKARRSVTVTLSTRVGASAGRTYRVRLVKRGKTVASGTLKGRTLKLTVAGTKKRGSREVSYARLKGAFTLQSVLRVKGRRLPAAARIKATKITVG
jgi:hypothetical protein